eukprot:CAMPEP_0178459304 /NCGR_PEP_ID=MMETSP0689_2-20121128/48051_1 /TAXON_ID=160604 /ORGANISM="Amphidinium massartii, Strain CS-259" /LENGTH=128 /DNA_ID=CAMNT_0020085757 /DNA_START=1 /DNA_END=387 /DNA_ORIENTATION=-
MRHEELSGGSGAGEQLTIAVPRPDSLSGPLMPSKFKKWPGSAWSTLLGAPCKRLDVLKGIACSRAPSESMKHARATYSRRAYLPVVGLGSPVGKGVGPPGPYDTIMIPHMITTRSMTPARKSDGLWAS